MYEDGELKMIYHPEGVIRPTPANASNTTEYVYDYFVKDYLGNVRVVITEENATYTDVFLATMEEVHAIIEEQNFDNLTETRQELPTAYPVNGSVALNERISELSAANGTEIGPSLVLSVKKGEEIKLSTEYFYEEDAPGTTYENLGFFVNEILISLAASGSGVLHLQESQLINIAAGDPAYAQAIADLLASEFDNTDIDKPHAYLVWMLYDNNMVLDAASSGAIKVQDPNTLASLISNEILVAEDGYLHAYLSNGSAPYVNFDNFNVARVQGKVRQINDYYPYGMPIYGLNGDHDDYLNKYTGKEYQTGEFDPSLSQGLEMMDFGSRFYDAQLGRWHAPDPAEQFSNPFLAMGNNPVVYVDPDGEFVITSALIIGAMIGSFTGAVAAGYSGASNGQILASFAIGALAGAVGGQLGAGVGTGIGFVSGATQGAVSGFAGGFINGAGNAWLHSANFGDGLMAGLKSGGIGAASGAAIGGVVGGFRASSKGLDFLTAKGTTLKNLQQLINPYEESFYENLELIKAKIAETRNIMSAQQLAKELENYDWANKLMRYEMKKSISIIKDFPDAEIIMGKMNGISYTRSTGGTVPFEIQRSGSIPYRSFHFGFESLGMPQISAGDFNTTIHIINEFRIDVHYTF